MKVPTSCGESYRLLVKYYGTEDLGDLSRASRISRSTLAYWRSCPKAKLRKNGRAHIHRILSESAELKGLASSSKDHGVAALIEMFQEVRDLMVRIEQKLIDRFS